MQRAATRKSLSMVGLEFALIFGFGEGYCAFLQYGLKNTGFLEAIFFFLLFAKVVLYNWRPAKRAIFGVFPILESIGFGTLLGRSAEIPHRVPILFIAFVLYAIQLRVDYEYLRQTNSSDFENLA